MDLGSLIVAALLSLGLLGVDATFNAGNVIFRVDVTKKLQEQGYTTDLVDSLIDSDLKRLVEFQSIVHETQIRSAEQKSIVGSVAEALNLKGIESAFQSEFGLDSIRLTGSLMTTDDGEFRFILSGHSFHTGKFTLDQTSKGKPPLPVFLREMATDIAANIEPYAVAVNKFRVLEQKDLYTSNDADREQFVEFIKPQLTSVSRYRESGPAAFFNLLGMASLLYHEHECAKKQFDRAVAADPELGVPYLNLAILAVHEKRFDDAIRLTATAEATKGVRRVPFLVANAYTVGGLALWGKNDLRGAVEQFKKAATVYPESMWANYYWSQLLASVGNADSAALLRRRAEWNLRTFESYPEVALLYIRIDPLNDFNFNRVNLERTNNIDQIEEKPKPETRTEAEPAHGCDLP